ncbi:polymerase basic subunit 2 [Upolu virus]|uniref:Polymerase basic subunit 2 n=1 Tax=Upolu virus TaxID=1428581 RepID=X2CUE5_9ORTO|nr:polymerase basic subunit 2 [Upolu virus]AHB34054.1 polymerase basic subunit 2 [Upolu virus]
MESEPQEQLKFLNHLITKFKGCLAEAKDTLQKKFTEYEVFKRYTTSKKDHAPQMRLCYSIRKPLPIIMKPTKKIPEVYNGTVLKELKYDLGESSKIRCSVLVPDYWSKYGETTTLEIADAITYTERLKVERFFSAEWGEIRFGKMLPYRKPVQANPTIVDMSSSNVSHTLIQVFCPQYATLDSKRKANQEAVEKLKVVMSPITGYRTQEAAIHIARSLIQSEKKWLPTVVDHTPHTAEMAHFLCSRYHYLATSNREPNTTKSMDSLCGELVRRSLKTRAPKETLQANLSKVKIQGRPLSEVLKDHEGEYPYLGICRVALGLTTHYSILIRNTKFVIMSSDLPRKETKKIFELSPEVKTIIPYSHFQGFARVYFQAGAVHGYFTSTDRALHEIHLTAPDNAPLMDIILDICYYGAYIEPGFEYTFGYFPSNKRDFFDNFFLHHSKDHRAFLKVMGIEETKPGLYLSPELNWKEESRGKVSRVYELSTIVQPYNQEEKKFVIGETLSVYVEHERGLELLINPSEIKHSQRHPLPIGLDLSQSEFIDIYMDPYSRAKNLFKSITLNKERCKEFVGNMLEEHQDPAEGVVQDLVPVNTWARSAKRKIHETIDEDEQWYECPKKRIKMGYFALIAGSLQHRSKKPSVVPKEFVLNNTQVVLDSRCSKGLIVDTGNRVIIGGETILRNEVKHLGGYIQTGVFDHQPQCYLVDDIESGQQMELSRFCIQSQGRFFQYEKKISVWEETDNIKATLEGQKSQKRRMEAEARIESLVKRPRRDV